MEFRTPHPLGKRCTDPVKKIEDARFLGLEILKSPAQAASPKLGPHKEQSQSRNDQRQAREVECGPHVDCRNGDSLKSSPGNQERSESGLWRLGFKILDHILESHGIARVGFDQRLVGFKNMEPSFLRVLTGGSGFCEGGGGWIGGFWLDRE